MEDLRKFRWSLYLSLHRLSEGKKVEKKAATHDGILSHIKLLIANIQKDGMGTS
jgi:hypothetical protein